MVTQLPRADEVSSTLREILAGPDFSTFEEPGRWRAIDWALDLLRDLWNWMLGFMGNEVTWLEEALAILVSLVVVVVAVRIVSRHGRGLLGKGREDTAAGVPDSVAVTASEWLAIATRRVGKGELRPAATALYQGFLLTLEHRGALVFHNSKTPGDYVLEISRGSTGAATHGDTVTSFLDSFQCFSFGYEQPTAAGYAGLARLARDAGCPAETTETEPAPGE